MRDAGPWLNKTTVNTNIHKDKNTCKGGKTRNLMGQTENKQ